MGDPFNNHSHGRLSQALGTSVRPDRPPSTGAIEPPITVQPASPGPVKFRPIHTRRAFEEICERIREQLALGVLKPGDKLPPERDLAQQLGVSRNVLREALRSLEMAGVLRLQKGVKGGAFIQEGDTSRMNDVMRDMLSLGTISVRELSEARIHVLDLVVRLACANARQPISTRLRRISSAPSLRRVKVGCSTASNARASSTSCWPSATGNKVIAMIVDFGHRDSHALCLCQGCSQAASRCRRLAEKRRQFLSALRARNVSAATRLMRTHLESVQRMLERGPWCHVASCRFGGNATGHAPLSGRRADRKSQHRLE